MSKESVTYNSRRPLSRGEDGGRDHLLDVHAEPFPSQVEPFSAVSLKRLPDVILCPIPRQQEAAASSKRAWLSVKAPYDSQGPTSGEAKIFFMPHPYGFSLRIISSSSATFAQSTLNLCGSRCLDIIDFTEDHSEG